MRQLTDRQFVDRGSETMFLEKRYTTADPEFLVVYGRRRIGKTRLLSNFLQNKPGIYFLCTKDSEQANIDQMKKKMSVFLRMPTFERLAISNWIEIFEYFFEFPVDSKVLLIHSFLLGV